LDPGCAAEAGAGTDSDGGCAAGVAKAEEVTDTTTAAVVIAEAGGTGGWGLTELMTGNVKTRVTGQSGEEEGPNVGRGGPAWIAGTTGAWRGGGGADWTRGIDTPVCWSMRVMNALFSARSWRSCCCRVSCLSWIVWNIESILSDICCWTAAKWACCWVRVWRITTRAGSMAGGAAPLELPASWSCAWRHRRRRRRWNPKVIIIIIIIIIMDCCVLSLKLVKSGILGLSINHWSRCRRRILWSWTVWPKDEARGLKSTLELWGPNQLSKYVTQIVSIRQLSTSTETIQYGVLDLTNEKIHDIKL
jgi:hypothetical protein